ncbi:MAG: [NiFe] hydrogenase metallocenter assembly protein HypD [Ignavibacteriae bacterium]|nr:MAG: [NiFe] hydrogenase metallocenter assembly protein HypD [Ignavibacteriota bacterium]
MKYIDEFRNRNAVEVLLKEIKKLAKHNWTIMEICGGQTHTILKYGIEDLLPESINLIHGPGCPVCVTPLEMIDKAVTIASQNNVVFTSYGDMLRVPGSEYDLLSVKAKGADVRIVYSSLEALKIAEENPSKEVVFFAVGFETTAPPNAMSVLEAKRRNIQNFSIICSHVLVPPAIKALLSSNNSRIQAFLAAGHVCTVMGYEEYIPIAEKFKVPIIVTGFEPLDILEGIFMAIKQLESGMYFVENQYSRSVKKEGNIHAKKILNDTFDVVDRQWRGIGIIPMSGLKLKPELEMFDAEKKFQLQNLNRNESELCIAGEVLQGLKKPTECNAFATICKPETPLGAPMVSSEGACAAYYRYKKI